MENKLFRQKSIDRISSPEALHDYMRVTSPRLWMILGAIVVLLIGFIIYASTATMENTIPIRVEVYSYQEEGSASREPYFYSSVPFSMKDSISPGMNVRIGDEQGKISVITIFSGEAEEEGEIAFGIDMEHPLALPDGEYDAKLVIESATPISFLWQ